MTTLQIEHRITDYPTWRAAFDRFDSARQGAGVLSYRIRRPVDDDLYIVIDLEFDDAERAGGFLTFLRDVVWTSPENAPALEGAPSARLLDAVA